MRASRYSWKDALPIFEDIPELQGLANRIASEIDAAKIDEWGCVEMPLDTDEANAIFDKVGVSMNHTQQDWEKMLEYLREHHGNETTNLQSRIEALLSLRVTQMSILRLFGLNKHEEAAMEHAVKFIIPKDLTLPCSLCDREKSVAWASHDGALSAYIALHADHRLRGKTVTRNQNAYIQIRVRVPKTPGCVRLAVCRDCYDMILQDEGIDVELLMDFSRTYGRALFKGLSKEG